VNWSPDFLIPVQALHIAMAANATAYALCFIIFPMNIYINASTLALVQGLLSGIY
jgi:hypothetical protein